MEIWKKIQENSNYEVSNYGGFKMYGKITYAKYPHTHRSVTFRKKDGEIVTMILHRLIFTYFKHEIPPKMVINHIDGVKCNNHIDNLECVTQSENIKKAYDTGLFITQKYKYGKEKRR